MAKTDPKLAMALFLYNRWGESAEGSTYYQMLIPTLGNTGVFLETETIGGGVGQVPSALETIMWGWRTGSDQKQIMLTTDRRDFMTKNHPTILVLGEEDVGFIVGNKGHEVSMVNIIVAIPRKYGSVNPRNLMNYAYQIARHIRYLILTFTGTGYYEGSSYINNEYSFEEDTRIRESMLYGLDWYTYEVRVKLHYYE